MTNLLYITRGNSTPNGKPRVFFTCHPDDFQFTFEQISNDILQIMNCVIWYDRGDDNKWRSEEIMESALGNIQLFVIPITAKLLLEQNCAMNKMVPFAIAHNIPVLPIIQEQHLDDLFYKRFGDVQYLNPYSNDPTEINYHEKLEKYLNSVLIGDELAGKIRSAFDAYIFLSYRKKDRKQAQELMRLIHANDFCRDIAIWYDEFLVPGEGFNQAISDALQKSELFALVVTPNLINEENYVMTTEYPAAKKAGKRILPAEVEATDHKALRDNYEGIPECIDAHNKEELSASLLKAIRGIALGENDADPQHNFFIGLAYLNGIDVEVNHNRALVLIEESASQGLSEAMTQLANMYYQGQGVQRDYETSLHWRKRLVETLRSQDRPRDLLDALQAYGEALSEIGKTEEAENTYFEMQRVVESMGEKHPEYNDILAVVYTLQSRIAIQLGAIKVAEKYAQNALKIRLDQQCSFAQDLAIPTNLCQLGWINQRLGRLGRAIEWFQDSCEYLESLVIDDENELPQARYDLASTYCGVGMLEMQRKSYAVARKYGNKSIAIWESLLQEKDDIEYQRQLMMCYNLLGDIDRETGHLHAAQDRYRNALMISQMLDQKTDSIQAKRDMADVFHRLGRIEYDLGDYKMAIERYEAQLHIIEPLQASYHTIGTRHNYAYCLRHLGDTHKALGQLEAAKTVYAKALPVFIELSQQNMVGGFVSEETWVWHSEDGEIKQILDDILSIYIRIGDIDYEEGNYQSAQMNYEQALKYSGLLSKDDSYKDKNLGNEALIHQRLGRIQMDKGVMAEAYKHFKESLKLYELNVLNSDSVTDRHNLWSAYQALGDVELRQGNKESAMTHFNMCLTLSKKAMMQTSSIVIRRDLSISYERLGYIMMLDGQYDEAEKKYRESLVIREKMADELQTDGSMQDLFSAYLMLGDLELKKKSYEKARQYYNTCVRIACDPLRQYNSVTERTNQALSYGRLAQLDKLEGNIEQAVQRFKRSIQISEEIVHQVQNIEMLKFLLSCWQQFGEIMLAQGNLDLALQHFEDSLQLATIINDSSDVTESKLPLQRHLLIMTLIAKDLKDFNKAKRYCEHYISISLRIANANKSDQSFKAVKIGYDLQRFINQESMK